jgi:hypothetical protein
MVPISVVHPVDPHSIIRKQFQSIPCSGKFTTMVISAVPDAEHLTCTKALGSEGIKSISFPAHYQITWLPENVHSCLRLIRFLRVLIKTDDHHKLLVPK